MYIGGCGNGILEGEEQCESPQYNPRCNPDCTCIPGTVPAASTGPSPFHAIIDFFSLFKIEIFLEKIQTQYNIIGSYQSMNSWMDL